MCDDCGVLCEAFPITDLTSLELYGSQGCTVIVGDLYIVNTPASISIGVLTENLFSVERIRGTLYVKDNLYRTAMNFLPSLVSVAGVVYIDNPSLIDARIPSLESIEGGVSVVGCSRLCPARYTRAGVSTVDDTGCTNQDVKYFASVVGSFAMSDVGLLGGIFTRILRNATEGKVRVDLRNICLLKLLC